jgi:hypothetical protein
MCGLVGGDEYRLHISRIILVGPGRPERPNSTGVARPPRRDVIVAMNSTKVPSWGGRIRAAKMNAEHARQSATDAAREAYRAEAEAWSLRMEGYSGPRAAVTNNRSMPPRWPGLA